MVRSGAVNGDADAEFDGRLAHLVRDGIVRPARVPLPKSFVTTPPPRPKRGGSAVRAVIDERREGR